ncbi:MAG: hypothetical protein NTY25_04775, partial [Planctomycetia bacterium]|nr:hypothetical protein [Planctomycetia bacterium]
MAVSAPVGDAPFEDCSGSRINGVYRVANGKPDQWHFHNHCPTTSDSRAGSSDPTARAELPRLLKDLGVRIGLNFREGRRNSRAVRLVSGGIMAFGNRPLPCTLRN